MVATFPHEMVVPPASEPVSVAEARAHLRIDHEDDDQWIASAISASRAHIERIQNRACMRQTWRLYAPSFDALFSDGAVALPVNPVLDAADVGIEYIDTAGATVPFDSGGLILVRGRVARVALAPDAVAPSDIADRGDAVMLTWVAGHADAADVPPETRLAIMEHVAQNWHNRDGLSRGNVNALQHGLSAMIQSDASPVF